MPQQNLAPELFPAPLPLVPPVVQPLPAPTPATPEPTPPLEGFVHLLGHLAGSLTEISGKSPSGVLSTALALVAEAHRDDPLSETPTDGSVAWVGSTRSLFFPEDAASSGVALDRLILLRLETPAAQVRVATQLAHSGAFGLLVVDLADSLDPNLTSLAPNPAGHARSRPELPPLSRLAGLARKHRTTLLLLTEKPPTAPSLDPRVMKRYDASRNDHGLVLTVIKDKSAGNLTGDGATSSVRLSPGFRIERGCREPAGMC